MFSEVWKTIWRRYVKATLMHQNSRKKWYPSVCVWWNCRDKKLKAGLFCMMASKRKEFLKELCSCSVAVNANLPQLQIFAGQKSSFFAFASTASIQSSQRVCVKTLKSQWHTHAREGEVRNHSKPRCFYLLGNHMHAGRDWRRFWSVVDKWSEYVDKWE